MNEPAHSPLGPSSSDRWIACPGSVLATLHLPDVDTEWSLLGTAAHAVAEACRRTDLEPRHLLDRVQFVKRVDGKAEPIIIDQQMVDGVQAFIDYVNDLPGDDYNEERVYFTDWVKDGFGTMDSARATHKKLYITDFKYGEGVKVLAKENSQLMLYALGFLQKYGWMYDIEECELTIFQPRLGNVDSWTISVHDLTAWAMNVANPASVIAMSPEAPFAAGEHCTFCKLRKTCATRAKTMFTAVVGEMESLDDQFITEPRKIIELTPHQIAHALSLKGQITKWFSDVAEYAQQQIENGKEIGGWKLVEGRSNRAWAVPQDEVERRVRDEFLDPDQLYKPRQMISPSQAEEVFGSALFREATKKKSAGRLNDLVMKPQGSPVLAPPDDPRPSIKASGDEMEEI